MGQAHTNRESSFVTNGAVGHTDYDRVKYDYYSTTPEAVECLLAEESFEGGIWECACGECAISDVLKSHGYEVFSSDIVDRGRNDDTIDFLSDFNVRKVDNIITNPPYARAQEFVEKSLQCVNEGGKVAMLLRIQFLEGQKRRKMFEITPPHTVLVFSKRISCIANGNEVRYHNKQSAICYAWFIWQKGFNGNPIIKWIN